MNAPADVGVAAVNRAMTALLAFGDAPNGLMLAQVSETTGLNMSTLLRLFESPFLKGNDSEQVCGVKVTRHLGDYLLVDRGSFRRSAGLMKSNRLSQQRMAGGLLCRPVRRSAAHRLESDVPEFMIEPRNCAQRACRFAARVIRVSKS